MMRGLIIAVPVLVLVSLAYQVGWQSALREAPELEAMRQAEDDRDAAFWAMLATHETAEDRACRAVFEAVSSALFE